MAKRGTCAIADGPVAVAPDCAVLRVPGIGGLRILHATRDSDTPASNQRSTHHHALWHVVAYTTGTGTCLIGQEVVAVQAPYLVLTSPGLPHNFTGLPGETAVYSEVTFSAETVRSLPDWSGLLKRWTGEACSVSSHGSCSAACADDVAALAGRMATMIRSGHPQAAILLQGMLSELLFLIFRHLVAESERVLPIDPVAVARRFIEAHAEDPIDLGSIARAAKLSPKHLGRAFAKRMGEPPMRYRRRVLMGRAAVLLRTSNLSIERLAAQLGFPDWRHFSRLFRAEHNISPARYRRGK